MRILIADDDRKLCEIVKRGLEEHSHAVDCVYNGNDGECYGVSSVYDLIILDVMMPDKDGVEVCRNLRKLRIKTPIIMLTAKDAIEDRVLGLDSGADDYLVKPFAFAELLARVRALGRREDQTRTPELAAGKLILNTVTQEVRWDGQLIDLTSKEYAILEYLMRHPNAVVSRTMIEDKVWNFDLDSLSNLVDVYIRRIRQKIDAVEGKNIIQTVRGAGYRLRVL
ncbi:MAG: response regulator transcription factor [Firmicutes bacterium]|nr:response regulator transcription factor [Bacillota bacterium]